ncbi:MAG: exosortase/archaeosortase family protein [Janthinobacterium lividum]
MPIQTVTAPAAAGTLRSNASVVTAGLPIWAWAVVALLTVTLYLQVGIKLAYDWYIFPDYAHGFLVPFFCMYVVWEKREIIRNTPMAPSWAGTGLVLLGLFTLITGVYGAELFLARISGLMLLAGLIWTFAGLPMLRVLKFPLLTLLLAIPFPAVIFNQITFPLQLFASRLAGAILPVFNVPVLREGNVIELPMMRLEVAEACSGIRSLMSLFTVAVIYGYLLEPSTLRRTLLALASIPIAVAANVLRIVGTGLCVQYWDPEKAMGFFHEFSGWLMFLFSLLLVYTLQKLMAFSTRSKGVPA